MLSAGLRGATAAAHPLWMCGFRSFFLAAVLAAPLLIGCWVAFLALGLPLPAVPGGASIWHAHELLFGFAFAAVAGFALTSIPEFTRTASFGRRPVRVLAGLWLLGRIGFWSSGAFGTPALLLAAAAHLGLLGGLAWLLAPRLWRDPERKHLAFLWALAALAAVQILAPEQLPWLLPVLLPMALAPVLIALTSGPAPRTFATPEDRQRPAILALHDTILDRWHAAA